MTTFVVKLLCQTARLDTSYHLPGGIDQGKTMRIKPRDYGKLPGTLYIQENNPGEVHDSRPPKAQYIAKSLPELIKSVEVELSEQLDPHISGSGVEHLYVVHFLAFP